MPFKELITVEEKQILKKTPSDDVIIHVENIQTAPFRSKTGINIHHPSWVGHLSCHISLRKCSILTSVFILILWYCHICYHPQEDLAKFGCKSSREIEKIQNPAIVWRPAVTYFLNLATSLYRPAFLAKNLQFFSVFPLHVSQEVSWNPQQCKILHNKKNADLDSETLT
jgi:hypothetical protein